MSNVSQDKTHGRWQVVKGICVEINIYIHIHTRFRKCIDPRPASPLLLSGMCWRALEVCKPIWCQTHTHTQWLTMPGCRMWDFYWGIDKYRHRSAISVPPGWSAICQRALIGSQTFLMTTHTQWQGVQDRCVETIYVHIHARFHTYIDPRSESPLRSSEICRTSSEKMQTHLMSNTHIHTITKYDRVQGVRFICRYILI